MEETGGSRTSQKTVVTIDNKALSQIKDIARELIKDDSCHGPYLDRVLYTALFDYVTKVGGAPGFTVKL